jgi:hypothetical protein
MQFNKSRVGSTFIAVGIWVAANTYLAGGILFSSIPAHAQEQQQGQECTADPKIQNIIISECQPTTPQGVCSGECIVESITTYSCKPTDEPWGQIPCTNGNGNGTYKQYASSCAIQPYGPPPGAICACLPGQYTGVYGTVRGAGCVGASGV